MKNLKILTSGESHGRELVGIIEGIPAGLRLAEDDFKRDTSRRREGLGRSKRAGIEKDAVEILSGVRLGKTTGAPIALRIPNVIHDKLIDELSKERKKSFEERITTPRPGHADYAGAVKFGLDDIRDVIERASARETAMRCALGIIAKKVLVEFGLKIISRVLRIADIEFEYKALSPAKEELNGDFDSLSKEIEDVYQKKIPELKALREKLESKGNTCGGAFQVIAHEMPVGLGSYTQADERLDSVLAQAIISIPSVKGFTTGSISNSYARYGNDYVDEFKVINNRIYRKTNNAGGVEGGISNGEPLVISGFVKPVPTLASPKKTIDMFTHEEVNGFYENADLWVVEAAGVIAESMVALVLLDQMLRKYGGDSMDEIHRNLDF